MPNFRTIVYTSEIDIIRELSKDSKFNIYLDQNWWLEDYQNVEEDQKKNYWKKEKTIELDCKIYNTYNCIWYLDEYLAFP